MTVVVTREMIHHPWATATVWLLGRFFVRDIEYFCKVMFEYFSLIFVGCKYFLLAVIVTPNDCCHINQIH